MNGIKMTDGNNSRKKEKEKGQTEAVSENVVDMLFVVNKDLS